MTEHLFCLHTFFAAPEDQGGGEFLVGVTRRQGGYAGRISFSQQGEIRKPRKLMLSWFNPGIKHFTDEMLIRMAINQAIEEKRFLAAVAGDDPLKFELRMSTVPYSNEDLTFFS